MPSEAFSSASEMSIRFYTTSLTAYEVIKLSI